MGQKQLECCRQNDEDTYFDEILDEESGQYDGKVAAASKGSSYPSREHKPQREIPMPFVDQISISPGAASACAPHSSRAGNCAGDYCKVSELASMFEGGVTPGSPAVGATELPQIESLSYLPLCFEEGSTIDADRSHTRYSKIVVHSARADTRQKKSKAWEHWLRGATAGHAVTLLGLEDYSQPASERSDVAGARNRARIPAVYFLDRSMSKISFFPTANDHCNGATVLLVNNIQVICPASEIMLFFDQNLAEAKLIDTEKSRAVLLQYATEDSLERRRICFLEESENARDRFVQALTSLWLEKRNDHSMWF